MKTTSFKIIVLTCLTAMFTAFTPATVNEPEWNPQVTVEPCYMVNSAFQVGEEIVYKLYYNWNFVWLSAGEVTFRVGEQDGQFHLSAEGRTYSSYEWFFKVRDYYETFVDKFSLLPTVSIRDVNEGKYTLYEKVVFDQDKNMATSDRGKTKETTQRKEYNVDECMHDMLSVIYYARNIEYNEFEAGQAFPVKIFMDKKVYPLQVKYKGKESDKKIKGQGKFNTIKFSPEVIAGEVFDEDTQMDVWVSDDENRIPLLIESPVSVGSVKAVLKSHSGLRYDLDAKVN